MWRISGGYSDLKVENVESCKIETIACGVYMNSYVKLLIVHSLISVFTSNNFFKEDFS